MSIVFTGARKTTFEQSKIVWKKLEEINQLSTDNWHVGDAMGVDAIIRIAAKRYGKNLNIYTCEGTQRYHFAERSKRMVEGAETGKLYAFADKLCPDGCTPSKAPNGKGSGTWLTIAYAYYLGFDIEVTFLSSSLYLPTWMEKAPEIQLKLF